MSDFTEDWSNGLANWDFYRGKRDDELEVSTDHNYRIKDGKLFLDTKREADGTWTSTHLFSKVRVPQRGGVLSVKVKAPYEAGIWPAIWMLGFNYPTDPWPDCGEIDLMEIPGKKLHTDGKPLFHANFHGRRDPRYGDPHWTAPRKTSFISNTWMKVSLDLRVEKQAKLLIDSREVATWGGPVYQNQLPAGAAWPIKWDGARLILSCAVGGWAGNPDSTTPDLVTTTFGEISWKEGVA